jgi:hypothetical protein
MDLLWPKSTEVLSFSPSLEVVLGHLGNLLEGLQEVVWAANKVGWTH